MKCVDCRSFEQSRGKGEGRKMIQYRDDPNLEFAIHEILFSFTYTVSYSLKKSIPQFTFKS